MTDHAHRFVPLLPCRNTQVKGKAIVGYINKKTDATA